MEKEPGLYLLGGFALDSDLPLPELLLEDETPAGFQRVEIRLGSVSLALPGSIEIYPGCFASPQEYLLHIPGVGRYLVSHGSKVIVEPEDNALELDVRGYLLSTVFVVLCHQRGLLPLHASAVEFDDRVVAFLAESGQGKSSLAAHLAGRGFRVVADDICLVDLRHGSPAVIPVAPWLKLWRTALTHLGHPAEGLARIFSDDDKYRLPLDSAGAAVSGEMRKRYPIGKLVILGKPNLASEDSPTTHSRIEELTPIRALPMLMNLTHHAFLLEAMGRREQNFVACGRVLSQAQAFQLTRPWGLEHMEATIDLLESFIRHGAIALEKR
ncbi:MAG TPA: hypothetical protein VGR96_06815 [Acidobacteriaceae bacterium]|nr:hypothetical protein [Acidobacteriaceae bacterium]